MEYFRIYRIIKLKNLGKLFNFVERGFLFNFPYFRRKYNNPLQVSSVCSINVSNVNSIKVLTN